MEAGSGLPRPGTAAFELQRMRSKLLDLTTSNRLLHFPIRPNNSRSIEIIDELPDAVYDLLVQKGTEMILQPLPEEKASPGTSLALTKDSPALATSNPAPQQLQLTEFTPAQGNAGSIDGPEVSRNAGHDLPLPPPRIEDADARFLDKFLQTALHLEKLEARLRRLAADSNTSVEETGINILHLALGFLEWYESSDSSKPRTAPLILIPLRLKRDKIIAGTECYRYKLVYEGEDIQPNLSLREMLRHDFAIALPEFDIDGNPEEYFKDVAESVSHNSKWCVRRRMVLGFFHFSKLRMYLDLAPDQWPPGQRITENPRVRDILEGRDAPDPLPFGEDDNHPHSDIDEVPLAVEADGSQQLALASALKGRNLVVFGPPGTGKSQTITNLIAGALARGKTILFVAEKLAALEVVRRNLDRVSLGDFCLELHSRKANKRSILTDLDRRMTRHYRDVGNWNELVREHAATREKLAHLSVVLGVTYEALGLPVWQVLWRTNQLRDRFRDWPIDDIHTLGFANPTQVKRARAFFEDLVRHLSLLGISGQVPWHGLYATRLLPVDSETCNGALRDLKSAIESLLAHWESFSQECGEDPQVSLEAVRSLVRGGRAIPPPDFPDETQQVIDLLESEDAASNIGRLDADLRKYRALQENIHSTLPNTSSLDGNCFKEAISSISVWCAGATRWKELEYLEKALGDTTREMAEIVASASSTSGLVARKLERWSNVVTLARILQHTRNAPYEVVKQNWRGHLSERALSTLKEARQAVRQHESRRSGFEAACSLSLLPTPEALGRILLAYRSHEHRLFGWLSSEFRAARRSVRNFLKTPPVKGPLTPWLEDLEDWVRQRDALQKNTEWSEILGPFYKAHETHWDSLTGLITWCQSLREVADSGSLASWALEHVAVMGEIASADWVDRALNVDQRLRDRLSGTITSLNDWLRLSLDGLIRQLSSACAEIGKVRNQGGLGIIPEHATLAQIQSATTDLTALRALEHSLSTWEFVRDLGPLYRLERTQVEDLRSAHEWSAMIHRSVVTSTVKTWLIGRTAKQRFNALKGHLQALEADLGAVVTAHEKVARWCDFGKQSALESNAVLEFTHTPLSQLRDLVGEATGAPSQFVLWALYCRFRLDALEERLEPLVRALELQRTPKDAPGEYFDYWVYSAASRAIMADPLLARRTRASIESAIERFRTSDQDLIKVSQIRLAFKSSCRQVPYGVGRGPVGDWTERALLEHEISKKKRHLPIRKLLQRAGSAILALKPCFMMSPLSVAQFLAPGRFKFDIVIMDEASQLRPEDAIGAVARGNQVVVVGDPKQLPPTSFFDRLTQVDEESDDEGITDDTESILDVCLRAYSPACQLKWHYRSRHESLIAFSNEQFYDKELLLFPSPSLNPGEMGIRHHFIEKGQFAGRCNHPEASEVVRAIIEHARREPQNSLGVVAFNGPQRELIEELLEAAAKKDGELDFLIGRLRDNPEPLFIKNLENVQGDERDVIFISYTYGPDPVTGKPFNRFGPINGENGWRRLNVLVTRAKKRVEVFTSLRPSDITPKLGQRGAWAMKAYLEYASTGRWRDPGRITERQPDSEFEILVSSVIERHGYKCLPQVGVAGFFIDIGVLHPDRPDEFVLGIECDGKTYHSSAAIRDRDRLRQEILESRGWRIHRVWSTDWWMNPDGETQRLIGAIERARQSTLPGNK